MRNENFKVLPAVAEYQGLHLVTTGHPTISHFQRSLPAQAIKIMNIRNTNHKTAAKDSEQYSLFSPLLTNF